MKTILIVDDQPTMITLLLDMFGSFFEEIRVLTANNGEDAIEIVKNEDVDLVVTDLEMPVMTGYDLLSYLISNHPNINVIVVTGAGSPEIEEHVYICGSFGYLEKPIKMEVFIELAKAALFPTATGHIKGINLASFLQLLHMERKSCTVKVSFGIRKGYLYLTDGEIVNARFENNQGEIAAYSLLRWPNPDIEIQSAPRKIARNIDNSLDFILMESAKKQDEYRRDSGAYQRLTLENYIPQSNEPPKNYNSNSRTTGSFQRYTLESNHLEVEKLKNSSENSIKAEIPFSATNSQSHLTTLQILQNSPNQKTPLEEKILRKWKFIESAFSDETICVFATYIGEEKITPLQGNDNLELLSEEVANMLNIVFFFSNDTTKGIFEFIDNVFGVIIVWNRTENYTIVVMDGFADKNAITWFRRKRVILEKAFLSD